jgi:hypothetical protein
MGGFCALPLIAQGGSAAWRGTLAGKLRDRGNCAVSTELTAGRGQVAGVEGPAET